MSPLVFIVYTKVTNIFKTETYFVGTNWYDNLRGWYALLKKCWFYVCVRYL